MPTATMSSTFIFYNEEFANFLLSFHDFETLVSLAAVSKELRRLVRISLLQRVTAALAPFLDEKDVLPFFDQLYSINGVVFGEVAQQVACPGSGAGLGLASRVRKDCLNHRDLNILVPGPDALVELTLWLRRRGYVHWRVMDLTYGWIGPNTHFAAGCRDPNEAIAPRTRSITLAFGSVGTALSTMPAPLGDKIGIISASRVHRIKAGVGLQMNFDHTWKKLSAPWSPEHDHATPERLVETVCASATRHIRYRQCRNPWCRDYAPVFGELKRINNFSG